MTPEMPDAPLDLTPLGQRFEAPPVEARVAVLREGI
jgi:hypothetical protein